MSITVATHTLVAGRIVSKLPSVLLILSLCTGTYLAPAIVTLIKMFVIDLRRPLTRHIKYG